MQWIVLNSGHIHCHQLGDVPVFKDDCMPLARGMLITNKADFEGMLLLDKHTEMSRWRLPSGMAAIKRRKIDTFIRSTLKGNQKQRGDNTNYTKLHDDFNTQLNVVELACTALLEATAQVKRYARQASDKKHGRKRRGAAKQQRTATQAMHASLAKAITSLVRLLEQVAHAVHLLFTRQLSEVSPWSQIYEEYIGGDGVFDLSSLLNPAQSIEFTATTVASMLFIGLYRGTGASQSSSNSVQKHLLHSMHTSFVQRHTPSLQHCMPTLLTANELHTALSVRGARRSFGSNRFYINLLYSPKKGRNARFVVLIERAAHGTVLQCDAVSDAGRPNSAAQKNVVRILSNVITTHMDQANKEHVQFLHSAVPGTSYLAVRNDGLYRRHKAGGDGGGGGAVGLLRAAVTVAAARVAAFSAGGVGASTPQQQRMQSFSPARPPPPAAIALRLQANVEPDADLLVFPASVRSENDSELLRVTGKCCRYESTDDWSFDVRFDNCVMGAVTQNNIAYVAIRIVASNFDTQDERVHYFFRLFTRHVGTLKKEFAKAVRLVKAQLESNTKHAGSRGTPVSPGMPQRESMLATVQQQELSGAHNPFPPVFAVLCVKKNNNISSAEHQFSYRELW
jgi:hypothetical protein